jgi:hypothetical protein
LARGLGKRFRVAEVEEYHELDDERVLVLVVFSGRGKSSGLAVEEIGARGAHLFRIRNGKVVKLIAHMDRERALADLGLAPEAGSPGS